MKRVFKMIFYPIFAIILVFLAISVIQFSKDIKKAERKLKNYPTKSIDTSFGKMAYVEQGSGEPVLLSHGIFGGYDQGIESLNGIFGDNYRKIAPSRFGYPGSDMIKDASPENQAKAYRELLDQLNIEKTFVVTTSAGGSAGIKFAIDNPTRVKGLILLSSAVPNAERTKAEIKEMTGPPPFILSNFMMWFSLKYAKSMFYSMMGVTDKAGTENIFETMLPVSPRHAGIKNDSEVTNKDMDINFKKYPVEEIKAPIIQIHAKDDPMVKYSTIQNFTKRTNPQTVLYENGGHLITGHSSEVQRSIVDFISANK